MPCELLDFRCIFVNEIVGSAFLATVLAAILFFIFVGKTKVGFRTSVVLAIPVLLMFGLVISGFPVIYAFVTVLVGFMLAAIIQKIIGNQGFI
jgi:hypothetical protein